MEIKRLEKLKSLNQGRIHFIGRNHLANKFRTAQTSTTANPNPSSENSKRNKVTYWAGMRIEGKLDPFERREDAHSKWHTGIANG